MTIRTVFIGAAALVLSAASANAQGRPPKPVVLSKAVLKSMVANKPKSKTPLAARAGIVRRASVVATKPDKAAPTSVQEIKPVPKKN
jgi:hypothetical protein